MVEYVQLEKESRTKLGSGESHEISFKPMNSGQITIVSMQDGLSLTRKRVELFKPDGLKVASDSGLLNKVLYTVTNSDLSSSGDWKVRETVIREGIVDVMKHWCHLIVYYPSNIVVLAKTVPASWVEAALKPIIRAMKIHITDGANQSYISFPGILGISAMYFTAPSYNKKILFYTLKEKTNDINSRSIGFSIQNATDKHKNGYLQFAVRFYEDNFEVVGTFNINMINMRLVIKLGLFVHDGKLIYATRKDDVDFECKVDIDWIPDNIADRLFDYTNKIQSGVENAVSQVFSNEATQNAISDMIMSNLTSLIGSNVVLYQVKIENDNLIIKYYLR